MLGQDRTESTNDVRTLYLDLLKKALCYALWPEPPAPVLKDAGVYRKILAGLIGVLGGGDLGVFERREVSENDRRSGRLWPSCADTMVGLQRLDNVQFCLETAMREDVAGDCIETGVWRGGTCILMRAVLKAHGDLTRRVFVADSFAGLPKPDESAYPADAGDRHHRRTFLAVSKEEVAANFAKYGLLDERVVFLEGWFRDTLPRAPIDRLAVLRLDGDMYESTMEALEALYPRLSSGGFCIVDDYSLKPCRLAVEDYRERHGIREEIVTIDWTGVYWRKGANG